MNYVTVVLVKNIKNVVEKTKKIDMKIRISIITFILFFSYNSPAPSGIIPISEMTKFEQERAVFYMEIKHHPFNEDLLRNRIS
jgi:hypothetical protein